MKFPSGAGTTQGKGKKDNVYAQPMTGQEKAAAIDHLMYACSWKSPSLSMNLSRRNTMIFKKGSHPMTNKVTTTLHTKFKRQ